MIAGIGIDLIEVERVAGKIAKPGFKELAFTPAEIAYCEKTPNAAEGFAARFAAKEAFFKAIGTGWMGHFNLRDVEIRNNAAGSPEIHLHGKVKDWAAEHRLGRILLSLTHLKTVAGAVVVVEKEP
ncbi:MAG: holo-ACP synthase [Saprospiraceae bacterium]